MADVFSKEKRSEIMKKVKSNNNKSTELEMIKYFRQNGMKGWRRNYKIFGKPDFVFLNIKVAIFLDGCFWHGHNCRNTHPKENTDYWNRKISRNIERDKEVTNHLGKIGWKVVRIWECELKNRCELDKIMSIIKKT